MFLGGPPLPLSQLGCSLLREFKKHIMFDIDKVLIRKLFTFKIYLLCHVYIYVCACVSAYIYIYSIQPLCVSVYMDACICERVCVCVRVRVCVHVCVYMCVCGAVDCL